MKKLSIEDKAKRYDEAIEQAKECHTDGLSLHQPVKDVLEHIFPELKESEDERIRKNCIHFLKLQKQHHAATFEIEECIAWLENQGEQKPAPKFKVRDKIQYSKGCGAIMTIEKIENGEYIFDNNMGHTTIESGNKWYLVNPVEQKPADTCDSLIIESKEFPASEKRDFGYFSESADKVEPKFKIGDLITNGILVGEIDEIHELGYHAYFGDHYADVPDIENWHKWTIQDAKDGDVLACNEEILLFKSYSVQGRICLYCWYNGQTNNFHSKEVVDTSLTKRNKIYPATKEQRDLLFKKMHEAGYEWDADKKELKKIEQKPAWSEEDETGLTNTIIMLKEGASLHFNKKDIAKAVNWLKSLKDRYTWKPSDDEIKALAEALSLAKNCGEECAFDLRTLYEQLKKLREE